MPGVAAAVLALAAAYGGMAAFLGGHVASNVTVDGVAMGGMSPRDATIPPARSTIP